MTKALQIVGDIAKLDVHPGDTVVVRLKDRIPADVAEKFRVSLLGVLPDGVKALVLDTCADIEVMRKA